ncbi:MAG: hypothetical protein PHY45_04465 [Rhodocyclaceae bacterium]|nr:hypothetical protein [Rhodocyclaceae bacterium]
MIAILASWSLPVMAEDLVIGKNAIWTRSVGKRGPGPVHNGKAPFAPLLLWMTYQGSDPALRYLRDHGALPIRHRWSVAVGGEVDLEAPDDTFTERLSVPLTVGSGASPVITKLAGQLAAQDVFTWRTWSKKESVSRGIWRVEVLYDDDTPVKCDIGGQRRPCIFRIEIR